MGLSVSTGDLVALKRRFPESAPGYWHQFEERYHWLSRVAVEAGLEPHIEPEDCEPFFAGVRFIFLQDLQRIEAYRRAGLPCPEPGDSNTDPVLLAHREGGGKPPRGHHLMNARVWGESFFLPQDFEEVLITTWGELVGAPIGSVPRLLAEVDALAGYLGIPDHVSNDSRAHREVLELEDPEEPWQVRAVESYMCVILRDACRASLRTGSLLEIG